MRPQTKASELPDDALERIALLFSYKVKLSHLSNVTLDRLDDYLDTMPPEVIHVICQRLFEDDIIMFCGLLNKQ